MKIHIYSFKAVLYVFWYCLVFPQWFSLFNELNKQSNNVPFHHQVNIDFGRSTIYFVALSMFRLLLILAHGDLIHPC